MGLADFYIKINFSNYNVNVLDTVYHVLSNENIFRILDKQENNYFLSIECKFDNFLPSLIILYDILSSNAKNISSIETHGIIQLFEFTNLDNFVYFMFSSNKDKLLNYYNQLGCLVIDSEKYYEKRIKLKKYYKKLK